MASDGVLERPTGQLRRWALLLGAVILAGSTAFLTWWTTTLHGLPDIGDPFDVEAFAERPIPEDANAYVLYRRAAAWLMQQPQGDLSFDWTVAGPVEKAWLEKNREALETWRLGTERPEALYVPSLSMTIATQLPVVQDTRAFVRLAKLEGTRLEDAGDLIGAWQWYRAIFRSSRHVGHHATMIERFVGIQYHDTAARQLTRWSKDPRVSPAMLRRALDAAIEDDKLTSPLSDNLKVEYLAFLKTYEDPEPVHKCLNDPNVSGSGKAPWFARDPNVFSISRGLMKEPERSRRVARLIYANLLAVCDLSPARRPPVAVTLSSTFAGGPPLVDLYRLDDSADPRARALPPEKLRRWFDSTLYAKQFTPAFLGIFRAIDRERSNQAMLVLALANRLYELERGHPPETYEDLVGPYLMALPEGYRPLQ